MYDVPELLLHLIIRMQTHHTATPNMSYHSTVGQVVEIITRIGNFMFEAAHVAVQMAPWNAERKPDPQIGWRM